ncbi:MAG: DUF6442 family protein [Bullifex sp.]
MTKEEILEKSRKEMKGMDVADIEISKSAIQTGWLVAVSLTAVIVVADAVVFSSIPVEMLFCIFGGLATVFWIKYFRLKKRHELFVGVMYTIAALCFLISWFIQIVG